MSIKTKQLIIIKKQNLNHLFIRLQTRLELRPGRVHVGDHGAHVAHDGSKDEHAHQEVHGHEQVLGVDLRLGRLADSRQGEGRPVEAGGVAIECFTPNKVFLNFLKC